MDMIYSTKKSATARVAKYFETNTFLNMDGVEITDYDVPSKVKEMWKSGVTQRDMMKELNMAQHIVSAIRRVLGIDGRNPNTRKDPSELTYGMNPTDDISEYNRRRHKAKREAAGFTVWEEAFFDKEMNLYACTCPDCKGDMLWPKEFFAPPSSCHYERPEKAGGIIKRDCLMRTITCNSYQSWLRNEKNIEWYLYLRWRSIAKTQDGIDISKMKFKRKEDNMKYDKIFNEDFLPLFKDLDKDKDGHYICPVLEKTMRREFEKGPRDWSASDIGPPSIDRIDSTKPHTLDNIQIISWRANNIKMNATLEELVMIGEWAETLASDINWHSETFIY
jgi:hypothetical protein